MPGSPHKVISMTILRRRRIAEQAIFGVLDLLLAGGAFNADLRLPPYGEVCGRDLLRGRRVPVEILDSLLAGIDDAMSTASKKPRAGIGGRAA